MESRATRGAIRRPNPARGACLCPFRRRYSHPVNRQDPAQPAHSARHQPDQGRSARLGVSGLTLALLITTALAGIAATADLSDRLGERSTRLATTRVELAATILLGHGLVALPAIANFDRSFAKVDPALAVAGFQPTAERAGQRASMVRAGLISLPPPAAM